MIIWNLNQNMTGKNREWLTIGLISWVAVRNLYKTYLKGKLPQGSVIFKCIWSTDTSTMKSYTLCGRRLLNIIHKLKVELLNQLISLKFTLSLSKNFSWTTSFMKMKIHTCPVEDLDKCLGGGSVNVKWICQLDTSTWNPYTLCGRLTKI